MPAISTTSWSLSWCACASSVPPLTIGELGALDVRHEEPCGRLAITATCTPGLPSVVSVLVSSSSAGIGAVENLDAAASGAAPDSGPVAAGAACARLGLASPKVGCCGRRSRCRGRRRLGAGRRASPAFGRSTIVFRNRRHRPRNTGCSAMCELVISPSSTTSLFLRKAFDHFGVHQRAVRAVEILEERVVEDRHHRGHARRRSPGCRSGCRCAPCGRWSCAPC